MDKHFPPGYPLYICLSPNHDNYAMLPEPLYCSAELRPAYQLRYGWSGWPSKAPFPADLLAQVLPDIAPEWENDGLRVLESSPAPGQIPAAQLPPAPAHDGTP